MILGPEECLLPDITVWGGRVLTSGVAVTGPLLSGDE